MKVFHGIDRLPAFRHPAATVGSFDGVHGGHSELLAAVRRFARERDGESIVVTFSPHPRIVLETQTDLRLLTTLDEKAWLLERAGIDNLVVIPFTREFSRTGSADFIRRDLIGKLGVETLVMGYNHHFGHNKEGDYGSLRSSERPTLRLYRSAASGPAVYQRKEHYRIYRTMITHDTKIRVWYKHTDQMGFVHHSNYICYYEEARSDLMRSMGLSYADMERKGIIMPILEVQSVYKRPAFFDDCLTVRILLREMPTARIRFEYEVYNSQGELLNTGMTALGFLHADTHRPTRAPQWFVEALAAAMK